MLEIKIFNKFQSSDININVISFVFVLRGKAVLDFEKPENFLLLMCGKNLK